MNITSVTTSTVLYVDLDEKSFRFADDRMGGWSDGMNSISTTYDIIEEMIDDEERHDDLRAFAKEVVKKAKELHAFGCDIVIQRDNPK